MPRQAGRTQNGSERLSRTRPCIFLLEDSAPAVARLFPPPGLELGQRKFIRLVGASPFHLDGGTDRRSRSFGIPTSIRHPPAVPLPPWTSAALDTCETAHIFEAAHPRRMNFIFYHGRSGTRASQGRAEGAKTS